MGSPDRIGRFTSAVIDGRWSKIEGTAGLADNYPTINSLIKEEIIRRGHDLIVEVACGSNAFPCLDILALGYKGQYVRADISCPPILEYRRWPSQVDPRCYASVESIRRKVGLPPNWVDGIDFIRDEGLFGEKVRAILAGAQSPLLVTNFALVENLKFGRLPKEEWKNFNKLPYNRQIHFNPVISGPIISSNNFGLLRNKYRVVDLGEGLFAVDLYDFYPQNGNYREHYNITFLRKFIQDSRKEGWVVRLPFQNCLVLERRS